MLFRSNKWNTECQFSSEYRRVSQLVVHKTLLICLLESGGLFILLNTVVSVRISRLCFIATLQSLLRFIATLQSLLCFIATLQSLLCFIATLQSLLRFIATLQSLFHKCVLFFCVLPTVRKYFFKVFCSISSRTFARKCQCSLSLSLCLSTYRQV